VGGAARRQVAGPLLRSTFRMLIDSCDDMTVVAEASNGEEAAGLAPAAPAGRVLMDIRMPVVDGLAATLLLHPNWQAPAC
jgi:DNA-binding NarL/FixJ family response regulator